MNNCVSAQPPGEEYIMMKVATVSMALLGAITLATVSSAMASETTVSGKLVDVAKWVSNDSTTMVLNMPDIMMSNMMSDGSPGMSGSGTTMSAHHPSSQSMTHQEMSMGKGMTGGRMHGCHAMMGIVTSSGVLYVLLANQASPWERSPSAADSANK